MEIYTLLSKYFANEATDREKAEVDAWRGESADNEKEFRALAESWQLARRTDASFVAPDKEKVWNRIVGGITRLKPVKTYSRSFIYRAVGIAAVVALLIGVSLPLLYQAVSDEEHRQVCVVAPAGQKAEVSLPDGTHVFLNSGSILTYSTGYSRDNRSVKLQGQGFFDVTKDSRHPFTVLAGDVKVLVKGTSFDVNAYTDNEALEVTLLSGRVSVLSASTDKLIADMLPNQKVTVPYDKGLKPALQTCDAEEEALWRLGKLKIVGETLPDLVRKMEHWYGVHISLQNVDADKRYWMTIKTESLKEMLEIINQITPINYSINGEEVNISCK